ncbi:MAG: hypothetical protein JO159_12045 [Acidobacteria bacterium]|nr:hypothetical protein [Acidobacteriota bacterium]
MELKHLISQFTYRIEPKPGGGFVAHPADPAVAPIEAPTRPELQKKIGENILARVNGQFPGLKLPVANENFQFAFHIERKPEGGFVIHSSDPKAEPIEVLTHNDMESHFAEKIVGFLGHHLTPELSQALAARGNTGDIKVVVNRNTGVTVNAGSRTFNLGRARNLTGPADMSQTRMITGAANATLEDSSSGGVISNTPISPEASSSDKVFRFLLLVLLAAAVAYFFLHYR